MCGCNGGVGTGKNKDSMGWYVILPATSGGGILPEGVNPEDPEAGQPGYLLVSAAQAVVNAEGGGTIHRLKRKPASASTP